VSARTDAVWQAWLTNRKAVIAARSTDRESLDARPRTPQVGADGQPIAHGLTAYNRGCSCDVCRAAKAAYMRQWRAQVAA